MSLQLILGVDVGNNATKVTSKDGSYSFPTAVDTICNVAIYESARDPMSQLHLEILSSTSREIPLGEAYYGTFATANGQIMPADTNKAKNPMVLQSMICAMAISACKHLDSMKARDRKALFESLDGKPLPVTIYLGTGLPMATWLKEDDRKAFRKALRGTHTVKWRSTPNWDKYPELALTVERVAVAAEGTAILLDLAAKQVAGLIPHTDVDFAKDNVLVVDIGANTIDAPFYKALTLDNTLSRPFDSELAATLDEVANQIHTRYSRTLTRPELERAIFERGMAIPHGKHTISIREIVEPMFNNLARSYANHIARAFRDSGGELQAVIVAGGGAVVVKDQLEKALAANSGVGNPLPFDLVWPHEPQNCNANGYYSVIYNEVVRRLGKEVAAALG